MPERAQPSALDTPAIRSIGPMLVVPRLPAIKLM